MSKKMWLSVRGKRSSPYPEVELWLENRNGVIVLCGTAVNDDGSLDHEGWGLLEFYEDGTFARIGSVGAPFTTSGDGQLVEVKER